jgi:hypothetical protein
MKKKRVKKSLDLQAYGPTCFGNYNEEPRALASLQVQAHRPGLFFLKKG